MGNSGLGVRFESVPKSQVDDTVDGAEPPAGVLSHARSDPTLSHRFRASPCVVVFVPAHGPGAKAPFSGQDGGRVPQYAIDSIQSMQESPEDI